MAQKYTWPLGVFARQQLTLKGAPPDNWKALARSARDAGALVDAAEFAAKAGDAALLGELENDAIGGGDLFAYQACRRARDLTVEPAALHKIAAAARERGLELYAQRATALLPQEEKQG